MNGASGQNPQDPAEKKDPAAREKRKKEPKRKIFEAYCTDLTQKARDGQLDNVIGRDEEIYRVVQILNRRTKNNPCLIGEPGVGKRRLPKELPSGSPPAVCR